MSSRTQVLVRRHYLDRPGWMDGTSEFHELCRQAATGSAGLRILEVGAGPSNATSDFLATLGEVHGIDPDPDVRSNRALTSATVLGGTERYPYPDESFDLVVSDYVVEHVDDPEGHLREIGRVLRPGGRYVFRTPNLFHYVAIVSALTPHWMHVAIANRLRDRQGAHDPYPTRYRMNTARAVRRASARSNFKVESLRLVEKEPSYGMANAALFYTFMAYERAVNSTRLLAGLRSNLFVVLRKQ